MGSVMKFFSSTALFLAHMCVTFFAYGQSIDLSAGLVAYYSFDGNAADLTANGYNGVEISTTSATDRWDVADKALAFSSSSSSSVTVASNADFESPSFSINVWEVSNTILNDGPVVFKGLRYGFQKSYAGGSMMTYLFSLTDQNLDVTQVFFKRGTTGEPGMITMTYDETARTFKAFFNGRLVLTEVLSVSLNTTSSDVLIGNGYDGALDEIRFYDRVLTEDEIEELNKDIIFPDFTFSNPVFVDETISFTDISFADAAITSWDWDFENDNNIDASIQNPTYTYNESTFYDVKLTISDGTNTRSVVKKSGIAVQHPPPATNLVAAEYFFDTDPGFGEGNAISISTNSSVDISEEISLSEVASGFHKLFVRVQDDDFQWSQYEGRTFYIQNSSEGVAASEVVAAEYFFDNDPGVGEGTSINITSAANINMEDDLNLTGLDVGFHKLYVRVKDDLSRWSQYEGRVFYIQNSPGSTATALVAAEYFIDEDPGFGLGTSIDIGTPAALLDLEFDVDPGGLSFDAHRLYIRVKDDLGYWSMVASGEFEYQNISGQTISFSSFSVTEYGEVILLGATATSMLPVTYVSSDESVATISGAELEVVGVGSATITAMQVGNEVYLAAPNVDRELTTTQAPLAAMADDASRPYGSANPTFTVSYSGFKGTDDANVLDTPPSTATVANETSSPDTYPITLTGGADDNYLISNTEGTLTVTKAELTATADDKTKTYGADNPVLTVSYLGFKNGEDTDDLTLSPTPSTTVTTTTGVGSYPISLTTGAADNYNITNQEGTFSVSMATLDVTTSDASREYGEANPSFDLAFDGFVNGEDDEVLDVLPAFASAATDFSDVGGYPISLSGGADDNYYFNGIDGQLTVTKAQLSATANDAEREYGDPNPEFSVSYTGFKGADDQNVLDVPPVGETTATQNSSPNTFPITLSIGFDNNYEISNIAGSLTVTKAALTATAEDKSKTYGAANPALTVSYTGLKNGESGTDLTNAPVPSTIATTQSVVGSYPIELTAVIDDNYLITSQSGSLTVNKAILEATANNASREYGDPNPSFAVTVTGFVNGEDESALNSPPSATSEAIATSDVGTYPITVSGGSANNYNFETIAGELIVTQAALFATADNKSKTYGAEIPELTVSYSGFKNDENAEVLTTAPVASTIVSVESAVGTYPITLSVGAATNYAITNWEGSLTVEQAELTATANDVTRIYGEPNPALEISYTGFLNDNTPLDLDEPPVASTEATQESDAGTYVISMSGGSDNNYNITGVDGELTIGKADQTIAFDDLPAEVLESTGAIELVATASSGLPVKFASSNETVATVAASTASIVGAGETTITASQAGNINYHAAAPVDQLLVIAEALGVSGNQLTELKTYPNPAIDFLSFELPDLEVFQLRLVDYSGSTGRTFPTETNGTLNIKSIASGLYLLLIETPSEAFYAKVVKK